MLNICRKAFKHRLFFRESMHSQRSASLFLGLTFDVTVRNTLQPAFLAGGAIRPGVAAEAGEAAKDLHHAAAVEQAGGCSCRWRWKRSEGGHRTALRPSRGLLPAPPLRMASLQIGPCRTCCSSCQSGCGNSMPAWCAVGCRFWTMLLAGIFPASLLA